MGAAAGPWGALAGGVLGTIAGIFSAADAEEDRKKKQEILEDAATRFNIDMDQIESLMSEYYSNPDAFLGTKEDVQAYRDAVKSYNPSKYIYGYTEDSEGNGTFDESKYDFGDSYKKTIDDFINPYYDKIIADTTAGVQHSAAGAGLGRGTGAAQAIATAQAQKEDELFKTALQQYNTDRAQSYTEWSGNLQRMQDRLNQLKSAQDTKLQMQNNLASDYTNQMQNKYSDLVAQKQNRSNGNLSLASMGLMI
jgi:histidinol phosphatase-like enzyme